MNIDKSMKDKQFAYLKTVGNKNAKTSSKSIYFQLVTQDGSVYFFTEHDMEKAKLRADKNKEDQDIIDVTYEVIISNH